MAGGDAEDQAAAEAPRRPAADPFLRFLIPAPKPRPAAPAALLQPPHRLIAAPAPVDPALLRPEERLFIVPPTRPDWLPPPRSYHSPPPSPAAVVRPGPPVVPPPSRRYHSSPSPGAAVRPRTRPPVPPPNDPRARNAGRFAGVHVNGARGRSPVDGGARPLPAFLPVPLPHDSGFQRPKAAAAALPRKEKKAWVAVQRKAEAAGDEDRAALSEGYSGGDEGGVEAEDALQPQPESKGEQQQEDDDGNRRLPLSNQQDDVVERSLPTDGTQDCSGRAGGDDRPIEVREISKLFDNVSSNAIHSSEQSHCSETLAFASVHIFSGHASTESSSTPAG